MKNPKKAKEWLRRAKSNLALAKIGRISEEILYEDLCFDAQQAAEKALKAICIIYGIKFSKVHDISFLIELLEKENVKVPKRLQRAKILTDYAVETRYPGEYIPVDEDMYKDALNLAEGIVSWAEKKMEAE